MESKIQNITNQISIIITRANDLKNQGMSDLEIAQFVHIELGKLIIYDNSYSTRNNLNLDSSRGVSGLTELSQRRQANLLQMQTNVQNPAQICRGMAEIYSAIMNTLNIRTEVVGVMSKEDVDGKIKNGEKIIVPEMYQSHFSHDMSSINNGDNERGSNEHTSSHYYCQLTIDGEEYIQDFLTEMSLIRIKIGEAETNDQIPGFHLKSQHRKKSEQSDKKTKLSKEYMDKILPEYDKYKSGSNDPDVAFKFVFQKLSERINEFGFEESKGFFLLHLINLPLEKCQPILFI